MSVPQPAVLQVASVEGLSRAEGIDPTEVVAADPANGHRPRSTPAQLVVAAFVALFAAWATRDVLIPLLLAMFFALIGNPIIRGLKRLFIPRFIGGLIVLGAGMVAADLLIDQLAEPASVWIHEAPTQLKELAPKLRALLRPVQEASTAAQSIAQAASSDSSKPVRVIKTEVNDPWSAFMETPRWVASVLAVLLLTYFFMVYGESFQRKAIAMLPSRQQKRVTADILQSIEREMSRYIVTITLINALVGAILAGLLTWIGMPPQQALLWGIAGLLLAVPLMVCVKIVLSKIDSLTGWATLLE